MGCVRPADARSCPLQPQVRPVLYSQEPMVSRDSTHQVIDRDPECTSSVHYASALALPGATICLRNCSSSLPTEELRQALEVTRMLLNSMASASGGMGGTELGGDTENLKDH